MLALTCQSIVVPPMAAAKAASRSLDAPSRSPNTIRCSVPLWRTMPSGVKVASIMQVPPITRSRPNLASSASKCARPLRSGTIAVWVPTALAIASSDDSRS
jgi:hypothetical protein